MKNILCAILAAAMLLAFCSCGSSEKDAAGADETAGVSDTEPTATPKPSKFRAVSARLAGGRVKILSAEHFIDYVGKNAVRFYFEFTNSGSAPAAADKLLSFRAEEDGSELSNAYAATNRDVAEYGNASLLVEPGVTVRCVAEFSYNPGGGELRFTISDAKEKELSAVFDPQSLPGRPGAWSPKAVANPRYYRGYSAESVGDLAEIVILGTEREASDPAYSYADVIRVNIDYTNLGSDPSYFESSYSIIAYQDGIEMVVGKPAVQSESYGNGFVDIDPGDTITVTRCWELRSESPVEIAVIEWRSGTAVCAESFSVEYEP